FVATRATEGSGVAYGAHFGGFVVGLTVAWLMDRRALWVRPAGYPRTSEEIDFAIDRRAGTAAASDAKRSGPAEPRPSAGPPADGMGSAMDAGGFAEAARAYFALDPAATRRRLTPVQSLALAEWLRARGSNEAALAVYRRHVRDYPNGPGVAEAHLGAGRV